MIKKDTFFKYKLVNLFSHIIMVSILGVLFHKLSINSISNLLTMYWSIKYFVIVLLLLLLIEELFIFRKSFKKVINHFSQIYYYIGMTYIFCGFSINKINIIWSIFFISLFLLVWSILQLISLDIVSPKNDFDENSDVEIKLYKQLMPTRKKELKKILEVLINNNYNEPFALLLNGNWGEGKTSIINVLTKKLKADGNHNIFIQPLMLDTSEKLIEYFFRQLEIILNLNGIYTGKGSPFKKYIDIVFQSINTLNLKQVIKLDTFLNSFDDNHQLDFRKTKETLENDINRLLKSSKNKNKKIEDEDLSELINYQVDLKKIFIIVDDFDRVEEETFKNTLIFIKEIVNFKGINVIFLMDENLLEKHKIITRDYLDKFVNKKVQLSKIGYQEIFDHFAKNINDEKSENTSYNFIVKKIKSYITENVSNLIKEFEESIMILQKKIDSLEQKNITKDDNKEKNIDEKNKLSEKKINAENNISKLKNGLSNSRKVKKVIREVQEILNAITEKDYLETQNFKRIDNLESIIIRIAIYKILFGMDLDSINKNYNDFYTVITKQDSVQNIEKDIVEAFFGGYFKNVYKDGVEIYILNDFFNAFIFNDSLEKLYEDKKTETEYYLNQLDSLEDDLDITSFEEVRKIQKIILFNSFHVDNKINDLRKKKLIKKITELYEKKLITFKNLFDILSKSQRYLFIDDVLYLSHLKEIIENMSEFQSKDDEKNSINLMDRLSEEIFFKYKQDFFDLINLQKSKIGVYDDIKDIFQFETMIKELRKIFSENGKLESSLEFFENLINVILYQIELENTSNKYIVLVSKDYEDNLRKFIDIYRLSEDIKKELKSMKIDHGSRFENRIMYTTKEEFFEDIDYMHGVISNGKFITNDAAIDYLQKFRFLLQELSYYVRNEKEIEQVKIDLIEKIYNLLPVELYRNNTEDKKILTFCTQLLGEALNYTAK